MDDRAEDQAPAEDIMLPEYDFSGKQGVRGKYSEAYQQGHATRIIHSEESDNSTDLIENLTMHMSRLAARLPEIELVYLFGSQASGEAVAGSDIDLGVLLRAPAADGIGDPDQHAVSETSGLGYSGRLPGGGRVAEGAIQAHLAHEVAARLKNERIDVVLLRHAPITLAYAVIAQGKLVYQRDLATRVEYEAQVLGRYGDYLPVLRAQREQILRGDEHGRRVQWYRAAFERTERALSQIAAAAGEAPR